MIIRHRLDRRAFLRASAALGVAAAFAPRRSGAAESKILRVRSYSDLQVLDPFDRKSNAEYDITRCLLPRLVRWKPGDTWEWEPHAAETIEQVDPLTIRFTLKRGIMWTGGFGEVTAEDVKYSFERIADRERKSPYFDDWSALDKVEVVDKYSGVIRLKQYYAPLWSTTLPAGSGQIVCKAAVEALPDKHFTTEVPASAGPYVFKSWEPKQRTVLARDPNWKLTTPYYDEIQIQPIEDEKAAEVAFAAGELDFTQISLSSLANYRKNPPPRTTLIVKPSLAYVWMGMNHDHPKLKDPRVRRAIQMAVDADAAVDAAYFGQAERATGIIAPGLPGHREKNLVTRNVAGAKKLLEEAGVSDLTLKLSVLNKTEHTSLAQVVQASLAEAGIQVEIDPQDSGTFWSLGDEKSGDAWKDVQLLIQRFTMEPDPAWATMWFTPDQVGVWNWERWNNAEFGKLHEAALHEPDTAKRDAMYKKMQDLMEEDGNYVFLTHEATAAICRDSVVPALTPDGDELYDEFRAA
ncbi:MAG: twin-arginine translocation signal domain-containing protein [Rhodospirillaceae bacterium]|nr:twin-arginine translocation signal domain-containing protein [Rhodospirillaceae bacterium]